MKKRIISTSLVLTIALLAAACGNKAEENANALSQNEQQTEAAWQESEQQETEKQNAEKENAADSGEEQDENAPLGIYKTELSNSSFEMLNDNYYSLYATNEYFLADEKTSLRYPKLADALMQLKEQREHNFDMATESLLDSQQFMIETESYPIDLTDYTECRVLRADNVLFSFIETNENYYGGAHGMYSVAGYAFDVETGKNLSFTDIVVDETKIRDLIAEKLDEEYGDIFFDDIHNLIDQYDFNSLCWSISYFDVTLYFNPYDLGPYASGSQQVVFPFSEYADLFDEKYLSVPEQFVTQLSEYEQFCMDVNGDGKNEDIVLSSKYLEDDCWSVLISVDGKETDSDSRSYRIDTYLIKVQNKVYLYLFEHHENDYVTLKVYDFAKEDFVENDNANLYIPEKSNFEERDNISFCESTSPVFSNPGKVRMASRLETLSTYQGTKEYHVNESGLLVTDDDYYDVEVSFLIKTLEDIPCQIVSGEEMNTSESGTIPAGTFVKIISATEDKVFVVEAIGYAPDENNDMYGFYEDDNTKYNTEEIFCIQLDEEFGNTLNGRDVWELFDGLMYAG
ncbi:RsiV family protein [Lacrimispora saccharolytica]|uniref:RsiV family protein n=1 Tax=Lacrimispora saccharolytica TaxID=84030 RepID=UPI00265CC2D8|nr:RsiV family protein [Lacrimispora saccharolytica]MCF2656813.1 DUF3298 domain-containing protein [Lacrimispora saccharolytica]